MLEIYRQSGREPLYNYPQTLANNVAHGVYTDAIVRKYSAEEIAQAAAWQNPAWDMDYDYAGANLLAKRYLCE